MYRRHYGYVLFYLFPDQFFQKTKKKKNKKYMEKIMRKLPHFSSHIFCIIVFEMDRERNQEKCIMQREWEKNEERYTSKYFLI